MTLREQLVELTDKDSIVGADLVAEMVGDRDLPTAWRELNGLWLLWVAATAGVDRRIVISAACDCVDPVLRHIPDGEHRPRLAVEATRAWCRGERSEDEVERAARDAEAAMAAMVALVYRRSWTPERMVQQDAVRATVDVADAVASYILPEGVADAAASAAHATGLTRPEDYTAARAEYLASCADLVRARIPVEVVAAALATKVKP